MTLGRFSRQISPLKKTKFYLYFDTKLLKNNWGDFRSFTQRSNCGCGPFWSEKDLIYAIGCVKQQKLSLLWFVYGDCYAASKEIYERIRTKIATGIMEIAEVEFSPTKELGRVNKVDPLGVTYLRIRGMWHIEHPQKVYNYFNLRYLPNKTFRFFALMKESKYLSFPIEDREKIENCISSNFQIENIKIKSPNNPTFLGSFPFH